MKLLVFFVRWDIKLLLSHHTKMTSVAVCYWNGWKWVTSY